MRPRGARRRICRAAVTGPSPLRMACSLMFSLAGIGSVTALILRLPLSSDSVIPGLSHSACRSTIVRRFGGPAAHGTRDRRTSSCPSTEGRSCVIMVGSVLGHIKRDVVVIGGGLAGLSTALELVKRGRQVTVLSRDEGEAASNAAGGMIAPQAERLPSGAYLDLILASRSGYSEWVRELEALAGHDLQGKSSGVGGDAADTGFWSSGGFVAPAFDGDAVHRWAPPPEGGQSQWLDSEALRAMEPLLSCEVVGGWWFPQDINVDARRLYAVLARACAAAGVEVLRGVAADGLVFGDDGRRAEAVVLSDGRRMAASAVVAATGAWLRELVPVPMAAHKGQMLSLRVPRAAYGASARGGGVGTAVLPLSRVLFAECAYVIPKRDGRIVVGATVEPDEWGLHTTPRGIAQLVKGAARLCPALADFALEDIWAGLRPVTPDCMPVLGGSRRWDNVFVAGGYWRNGVALAPKTGQLVADAVVGSLSVADEALARPFAMDRFMAPKEEREERQAAAGAVLAGTPKAGTFLRSAGSRAVAALTGAAKATAAAVSVRGRAAATPFTAPKNSGIDVCNPSRADVDCSRSSGIGRGGSVEAVSGIGGAGSSSSSSSVGSIARPQTADVSADEWAEFEAAAQSGAGGGYAFEGLQSLFGPGGSGPLAPEEETQEEETAAAAALTTAAPTAPTFTETISPAEMTATVVREAAAAEAKVPAAADGSSGEEESEFVTDYEASEFFSEEELRRARQSNRNLDEIFGGLDDEEDNGPAALEPPLRPGAWEPQGAALVASIGAELRQAKVPEGVSVDELKEDHVRFASVTWHRKDGSSTPVPFGTNIYRMSAEADEQETGSIIGSDNGGGRVGRSGAGAAAVPAAARARKRIAPGPPRGSDAVRGEGERPPEVAALYDEILRNKAKARSSSGGNGYGGGGSNNKAPAPAQGSVEELAGIGASRSAREVNGHQPSQNGGTGEVTGRWLRGLLGTRDRLQASAVGAAGMIEREAAAVAAVTAAAAEAIDDEDDRAEASFDAYEFIMQHRNEAGAADGGNAAGGSAGSEADAAREARRSNRLDPEEEAALFEGIAAEAAQAAAASFGDDNIQ